MFPRNYFPAAYFPPRYFPPVVVVVPVVVRSGETFDSEGYKFDHIGDENEIIEMIAIILLMVD